jgi:DNA ligase-1
MSKRQFVLLAYKYEPRKHFIANWFMSTKLDGIRCFWDGGLSRGLYCDQIPWANVEKDYRLLSRPKASGLWSRLGKVIYAPNWFLDQLPNFPLDGELWCPSGTWQMLSSIVKQHNPNEHDWHKVVYSVFDSPPLNAVFSNGIIDIPNFKKVFNGIDHWINERMKTVDLNPFTGEQSFQFMYEKLLLRYEQNSAYNIHPQIELPYKDYQEALESKLKEVINDGGEGLIMRAPFSIWTPERSHSLVKYKPYQDDEGIVTGFVWGRKTDLGSKLLGKMGALILNYKGKRLELSGFTDEERRMISKLVTTFKMFEVAEKDEGKEVDINLFENPMFPLGSKVTFRYRELSDTGIPKEARYLRKPI